MIKEGKSINLSLHFLEQVIISLREQMKKEQVGNRRRIKKTLSTPANGFTSPRAGTNGSVASAHHIPYRNSLLTTVLRDSLGGNCKSCFLLTISMDCEYFEESISTLRYFTLLPPLTGLRFGQRCGEIQVKVQANLEIDMKSQLAEANTKISELEHRLHVSELENTRLAHMLQEKEEIINHLSLEELRSLTDEEKEANERLVISLNEDIKGLESHDMEGIEEIISQQVKGYRKPILVDVICRLSSMLSLLQREVCRANAETKSNHARKMFHLSRSFSMDSKFDDFDPVPVDSGDHNQVIAPARQNSFGIGLPLSPSNENTHDIESPRAESTYESPHQTPRSPFRLQKEPSVRHGVSRKLKPLLEGTTIISHGMFGVKYKTLSLSSDGKSISWKELSKDEGKTFLLADCER